MLGGIGPSGFGVNATSGFITSILKPMFLTDAFGPYFQPLPTKWSYGRFIHINIFVNERRYFVLPIAM